MNYDSGVVDFKCKGKELDHAILAVGWGQTGNTQYLIVKNSWGEVWGEKGYIRLQIDGREGACGVL
jgi:C1A family cysteine protease